MLKTLISLLLFTALSFEYANGYSAFEDARIIANFKRKLRQHETATNHAKVARTLVHQANWASVGSISTNEKTLGYPMVNIISIDDSALDGSSTGKIHFLLTDLDFTGPDWKKNNKVTFLFTDEQKEHCQQRGEDPMEPTCARTMISGKVSEMNKSKADYNDAVAAFKKRHPAATNWMKAHAFYLCELQIENIFVLDYYGGPHNVPAELYYSTDPEKN